MGVLFFDQNPFSATPLSNSNVNSLGGNSSLMDSSNKNANMRGGWLLKPARKMKRKATLLTTTRRNKHGGGRGGGGGRSRSRGRCCSKSRKMSA